jgi:hypothetical protein
MMLIASLVFMMTIMAFWYKPTNRGGKAVVN